MRKIRRKKNNKKEWPSRYGSDFSPPFEINKKNQPYFQLLCHQMENLVIKQAKKIHRIQYICSVSGASNSKKPKNIF